VGASAIRLSARVDMFAVALRRGVKTQRKEFSATPLADLENSHSFSFRYDIPPRNGTRPVKDPLDRKCEDTNKPS